MTGAPFARRRSLRATIRSWRASSASSRCRALPGRSSNGSPGTSRTSPPASTQLLSPKDYLRLTLSGERASDMSDAAGDLASRRGRARLVSASVRRLRRGSRLGAAAPRGIGAGRPDPARGRRCAWPAARRSARGGRRRRCRRRGGPRRDRAGRSVHLARNRDPAHRRDRPIHERAGEARAFFRPRAAGPLVRDGGDAQRRRRARFRRSAPRRVAGRARARGGGGLSGPRRGFSSCPISAASGRRSTTLMRAASCSA